MYNKGSSHPNDAIQAIYNINGFNNYKEFIYPNNQNVEFLHRMLNYEPKTASRYSSFIFHFKILLIIIQEKLLN
jgi:hypothetical protein